MIKKLFFLLGIIFIAFACNNTQTTEQTAAVEEDAPVEIAQITVADFGTNAAEYVGQEVKIEGLVSHTCKHGGKRMFIVEEGVEDNVKIETGDNIDSFDAELEGSTVMVHGLVAELRIDEDYLNDWENEVMTESGEELTLHDGKHEEGETEEDHHGSDLEQIESLRNQLKESEQDHLSFYSITCIDYEVLPPPAEVAE